jgi:glutamate carboxypeptidase
MKGGLVVMIEALRTLHAAGSLDGRHLTVVINADEEVGSPESGDLIRSEAAESQLCLCFEAGRPTGDGGGGTFVTRRRGFGRLTLVAKGRAAHAGVAPERGASALLELCHKAIDLSALSDPGAGIHVTVGILRGGTAANTVPAAASLELDYRFPDEDAQVELEDRIFAIAARNIVRDADGRAAVATTLRDHIKRPALVRTDAIARMAQRIVASGRDLGLVLEEEGRGGSSDAALAAEVGCPAVCGLGVVGDAFHTEQEWIRPSSLVERARLAALTIARFYAL